MAKRTRSDEHNGKKSKAQPGPDEPQPGPDDVHDEEDQDEDVQDEEDEAMAMIHGKVVDAMQLNPSSDSASDIMKLALAEATRKLYA